MVHQAKSLSLSLNYTLPVNRYAPLLHSFPVSFLVVILVGSRVWSESNRSLPFRSTSRAAPSVENHHGFPKFGEWNDRDATAPDNYTAIFNKVREERQEASIRAPTLPRSNVNSTNQDDEHNQKKCCCFPWPRK